MDKYISKELAINLIEHNDKVCHYADERYENVVYATTKRICNVVAEMPAADVQPVNRGRWKSAKNGDEEYLYLSTILGIPVEDLPKYAYCSECKFSFATNGVDKTGKALIHKAVYKYCPNCGARMDDDKE